jgi:hypothetical protein
MGAARRRVADTIAAVQPQPTPDATDVAQTAAPEPAAVPIGRSGRFDALALSTAGDHALLVRDLRRDNRGRALLTTDKLPSGERLVVMPLDDEVDVRVDGDALAVWLGAGAGAPLPRHEMPVEAQHVPFWATLIGGGLLLLLAAFAAIGSAVTFTWLVRIFG